MARSAIEDICKTDVVSEVVIADIRERKARQIAEELCSGKGSVAVLDINDSKNLHKALKACDVVVNTAGPYYRNGVKMVEAAIDAKVNYVDICDDYDPTLEMLDLDKAAKDAGVTILIGWGESPGTTNVLAKYGADKLDRVDEIHTYWGSSWGDPAGFACIFHMLHGLKGNTPQYLEGELVNVSARAGKEITEFPEPVGKIECYYIGHPEPITLPRYIKGVRSVTNRGAMMPNWSWDVFWDLIEYGWADDKPIDVQGVSVVPIELAVKLLARWSASTDRDIGENYTGLRVDVKGEKAGKKTSYSYVENSVTHSMAQVTGAPLAIGTRMLCSGEIQAKGVFPPEAVVDPERFLEELAKRDIRFEEIEAVSEGI